MNEIKLDYIVLGGGLAGLSFSANINSEKIRVIEKLNEPGGLVRSIKIDDFWFDSVVHLLHFQNDEDKNNLNKFISDEFYTIHQNANVITEVGETKFPFQLNLGFLPKEIAEKCASDYIESVKFQSNKINNFKEWLKQSFGEEMCNVFFYPYNEKFWKRPLESIAPKNINWTIQQLNSKKNIKVLASNKNNEEAYNFNSLYPITKKNSSKKCMGILTDNIYNSIEKKVLLNEEVQELNIEDRYVISKTKNNELKKYYYSKSCISTIPLPELLKITTPEIQKSYEFKSTGVIYAMVMLKGEKYKSEELSSYYASSEYVFSRVIFMQNFDTNSAPTGFWSLMTEITYNTSISPNLEQLESEIKENLLNLKLVKSSEDFIKIHFESHPYAYNVFEKNTKRNVDDISRLYQSKDIHLLGRYGKWQYISMAQGYTEALKMAELLNTSN